MSIIFQSGVFEYQLPSIVGATQGEVMTVGPGGTLTFAAGGGGAGGLTQVQVYGQEGVTPNPIYQLPRIADAQDGEVLTAQGGELVFAAAAAGGLTQEEVYGAGNPIIEIPPASSGQAGEVLSLNAQGELEYTAAGAGDLTQAAVYGAGNPIIEIPPASSGQAGEFLSLNAQGELEYAAGGGSGGLTQEEVYGAGNPIIEIPPASSGQAGEFLSLNAQGGLEYTAGGSGGLTQSEVYGSGDIYTLPVIALASEGQVATVQEGALVFANPTSGLTQAEVYGGGAIYELPELATAQNGQVATVQGGNLVFAEPTGGLQANQVWAAGNPQYTLPNVTGVNQGASLVANGSGGIEFFETTTAGLLAYQVYGGTEQSPNTIYSLGEIANADEGDVLTNVGGQCLWQAQAGVTPSQIWVNPDNLRAQIPDFVAEGALTNSVLTLTNIVTGSTAWIAQQSGLQVSDVWQEPVTPPAENYRLPPIGVEGQILTVSSISNQLEFASPPTVASVVLNTTYSAQFPQGGAAETYQVQLTKTGSVVTCVLSNMNPIESSNLVDNFFFTVEPTQLSAIEPFLPPASQFPYFLCLGYAYQTTDSAAIIRGFWKMNTTTGVISFYAEELDQPGFPKLQQFVPGTDQVSSGVYLGTWVSR